MKKLVFSLLFVLILLPGCFGIAAAEDTPVDPRSQIEELNTYIQSWEENYEQDLRQAGINPEEAEQYGYIPNPLEDLMPTPGVSTLARLNAEAAPSSYDLRDYGRVASVRNQGSYGTCWAFSVINSIETSVLTQNLASEADLSERHLAYFTYNRGSDPLGNLSGDYVKTKGTAYYANGFNNAFTPFILSSWTGPVLESKAPYNASPWTNLAASLQYGDDAFHVKNIHRLSINYDRDGVKAAIQTYGAGVISYLTYSNYYQSGTYNGQAYTSYCYPYSTSATNHSVSIIGWDDNFPKENFLNTPSGNGAWLVKQSWGDTWGTQGGYFWLSYYDGSLYDDVYFYEVEPANTHERCYQYDGSASSSFLWNDKMANIFTAQSDELISAVSFGVANSYLPYTVKVYTGCTNSNPESGTLAVTVNGTLENEYIKTVDLPANVAVSAGQNFSVVVDIDGEYNGHFLADGTYDYSWVQFISYGCPHQSFYYSNGRWYDMNSSCSSNAVIARIKAYTVGSPVGGFKATLSGQTATLSWNAVDDAVSYEVYRSASAESGFTQIGTVSETSFDVTDIAYGSTQYFKVRALLSDGQYSDYSSTLKVTNPIPTVNGLQASMNGTEALLSWNAVIDAASYEVYQGNSASTTSWQKLGTPDSESFTVQNLIYGNTYYFKVRAKLSDTLYSNYSAVLTLTVDLPEVTGLSHEDVIQQTVSLTWDALEFVKNYEIYSATSPTSTKWTKNGTSTSPAFTVKNLTYGATYYFKVRALFTNNKYSAYSYIMQVYIPLPTVTGLSGTANDRSVQLTWDALTGVKNYIIYSGDSATASSWKKLGTSTQPTFTVNNLTYGNIYYYKVQAQLTTGNYSEESEAAAVPVAPNITGLQATLSGITAQLTWNELSNASSYEIELAYPAKTLSWQKLGDSNTASFTASDLQYGTTYNYRVRAVLNDGTFGTYSNYSGIVQVPVAIPAVSGLTASPSGRSVQLTWNELAGIQSYEIDLCSSTKTSTCKKTAISDTASYTVENLVYGSTYYFSIRALLNNGKYSNFSNVAQATIETPAVTGLTPGEVYQQTVPFTWDALDCVKIYEIYIANSASATKWTRNGTSASPAFTAKNLTYGATYYFKVRAQFTNGKYGAYSDIQQVVIPIPTVTGLNKSINDRSVVLTWDTLTGIKSYIIYSGDSATASSWKKLGTSTKPTFTIKNLSYGSIYYYKVQAQLSTGKYSNESAVLTVPIAPNITGLKAVLNGNTAVLSWDALSDAASYEIEVAYDAKNPVWQKLGESTVASYTAQDLLYGTTQYYRVRAVFANEETYGTYSSYSGTVQVPVAIPSVSGLTAAAGGRTIQLSWNELPGIQSYEVALCTSTKTSTCKKAATTENTSYTAENLIYGGTYYYSIRALLNSGKYSNFSNVAQATIETPAVTGLSGTVNEQTVPLTWDALECVKTYEIYSANSPTAKTWKKMGTSGSTAYNATKLTFGTTYYFKVRAQFTNGKYSNYSNIIEAPIVFPSMGEVTAAIEKQTVQLSWNAINSAVSYEVSRSTSETSGYKVLKNFKGTSYTDTGLSLGTTYYYRVRAKINNGKYTNYSLVKADIDEEKVTGLSLTVTGMTGARLSWRAKSNVVTYEVYRAAAVDGDYEKIGTPTEASFDDTGLAYGQTYYYKVRALCTSGLYSEFSDPLTALITLKAAGLSAAPCDNSVCANLQWTALDDAVSYDVYRADSETGNYTKVGNVAANTYSDSTVSLRQTYYYKVQAILNGNVLSEYSDPASVTVILKVTGIASTSTITWNGMPDAVLYEVCRSSSENGSCEKTETVTAASYTDTDVAFGHTYYYKVRAKLNNGEYCDYSDTVALTISSAVTSATISKEVTEEFLAEDSADTASDDFQSDSSTGSAADSISFFWLGNDFLNDPYRPEMPATGFPTGHFTPLPAVSASGITPTGVTLSVPSLELNAEVAALGLDEQSRSYDVSALNYQLGCLEGTALPGQGFSILVGHNHLNTMEAGPFARLHEMGANSRLFITDANNTLTTYSVYANLLVDANDYRSIADNVRENALLLITCEDETMDGGYLHRRVVFAEPLG